MQVRKPLEKREARPETAAVLRKLVEAEQTGTWLDPWLPFPQNACCFVFGNRRSPAPVGALRMLWRSGWPFAQPCPECGGIARMVSFGGLLNVGGGNLVCAHCDVAWFQPIGGLASVSEVVAPVLKGSEFHIAGATFGGANGSDGAALLEALGLARQELEPEMPSLATQDGARVRFEVTIPPRGGASPGQR